MKNGLFLISLLFFITNISFSQRVVDVPFIKDEQINLDGILDKGEWESSEKLNLDNETEPGYNIKPIVETVGFIQYSEKNLYVAFHAKTNEEVRAALRKRDDLGAFSDDLIGISLDPYGDGRNNIFMGSNPLGSQIDVRVLNTISEEQRYDFAYDLEYESAGTVGENEYFVELKIPFSSIPFPSGKNQEWKFSFVRRYLDYFIQTSKVDRDNSCQTCQLDDIIFFDKIKIDKKFDLLPYISSSLTGARNDKSNSIDYQKIKPNIGIGVNAELTKSLSLE